MNFGLTDYFGLTGLTAGGGLLGAAFGSRDLPQPAVGHGAAYGSPDDGYCTDLAGPWE